MTMKPFKELMPREEAIKIILEKVKPVSLLKMLPKERALASLPRPPEKEALIDFA